MSDSKKTAKGKESAKSKKLGLNKETLRDLSASKPGEVKGGYPASQGAGCSNCQNCMSG